jgi:cytochrome c551/c552
VHRESYRIIALSKNLEKAMGPSRTRVVCALLMSAVATSAWCAEPEALIKEHGCRNCHDDSKWTAGPPFKMIATKYRSTTQGAHTRALSALRDGAGHLKTNLSEGEIRSVTQWILAR